MTMRDINYMELAEIACSLFGKESGPETMSAALLLAARDDLSKEELIEIIETHFDSFKEIVRRHRQEETEIKIQ